MYPSGVNINIINNTEHSKLGNMDLAIKHCDIHIADINISNTFAGVYYFGNMLWQYLQYYHQ